MDKDLAELLVHFLKEKYPHVAFTQKTPNSPWLEFTESSSILYIKSSTIGWYGLDESIYDRIISTNNCFTAVILEGPEKTFILPREKIEEIFTNENKIENEKRPRWMFDIENDNNNYFLKIKKENININDYLNRWDLIPDFKMNIIEDNTKNFFLVQVSDYGSKNILDNLTYSHPDWQSNKRDYDHGKVNIGDYLLIYFSGKSIDFKHQLKKIYRVDSVSQDNIEFKLSEIKNLNGITSQRIQDALKNNVLTQAFVNVGLQGFNIKQIPKEDYNSILSLDKEIEPERQILPGTHPAIWVVRAGSAGAEEKDALDNNLITIHYGLYDFSSVKNKNEIIDIFLKNPDINDKRDIDEKRLSATQYAGQIWSFLKDIKKNDVVILPLKSRQSETTAVGIVKGDYEFKDISKNVKSIRQVEWLNKEIKTSEFDETALRHLRLPRTVFRISSPSAIHNILDVMKRSGILPQNLETYYRLIKNRTISESESVPKDIKNSIEELSNQIYISLKKLKEIEYLLNEKKQIIFYGPPGTSKTFVAKKFSEYYVDNNKENIEIIQFHPSYSYEDFVEGIKPRLSMEKEVTGFIKQPGILKNLVDKCIKNPEKKFVLIIDEINRGNISKIFGELIYLLEYRNDKIRLTYSPNEEFYIPKNLYIIGTMNSADRSIAFVDYALRRRFYFIEFYPDAENEEILKKWFIKNGIKNAYRDIVVQLLTEINILISTKLGREYQIGYSYFMNKLDYEIIKRIVDYAIIPLIEQYFFGKKENVDEIKKICNTYLNKISNNPLQGKENLSPDSFSSQT